MYRQRNCNDKKYLGAISILEITPFRVCVGFYKPLGHESCMVQIFFKNSLK